MAKSFSIFSAAWKVLLAAVYAMLLVALGPVSVYLAFGAVTMVGRGLAALGLLTLLIAADLFVWFRRTPHPGIWGASTVILSLVWIAMGYGIVRVAPTGQAPPGSPVRHRFASGGSFPRTALANLVPESEQIALALRVAPLLDPLLTADQAGRVRKEALGLYEEMDRDRAFRALGSAMCWTYADAFGLAFDRGHFYLYSRHAPAGRARAAILFLHGRAGNLKAHTWIWSRLALRRDAALVVPSFGRGEWGRPAGADAALRALDDAAGAGAIDPRRVVVVGLSTGARGVWRLAADHAERFAGAVAICPVPDEAAVSGPAFARRWGRKPMLVIAGESDRRVPLAGVRRQVRALRAGGANVKLIVYPGQDHFLWLSKRQEVLSAVAQWMETHVP